MKRIVWIAFVPLFSLSGADVTGKWDGKCEYTTAKPSRSGTSAFLFLKQDADKLSGTAGPVEEHQFPIKDARVESDTIIFSTNPSGNGADMHFKLKLSGGSLQGEMTQPAREGQAAQCSFVRVVSDKQKPAVELR